MNNSIELIIENYISNPIISMGCFVFGSITIFAMVTNNAQLVEMILIATIGFLFGTATAIKSAQKKSFKKKRGISTEWLNTHFL